MIRRAVAQTRHAGLRLDAVAPDLFGTGLSRSQFARQISTGALAINGAPCPTPSRKVQAGDEISWTEPEAAAVTPLRAQAIALTILHEDVHLVVLDKPAGLVVHPAPGHQDGTLVNALLAHCRDLRGIGGELRPGIVHRLDKDTSGLMVVAKDDVTMAALQQAFSQHDIERAYEALVVGRPAQDSGRIDTLHGRDPRDRKKFTTKVRSGRRAITNWRVLEPLGAATRVEARLETGRTHQVRVHLAAMGCPLLGDKVYGKPPRDLALRELARTLGRQALHARVLGFRHPATGKDLRFETPPPADFAAALAGLRALAPWGAR